MTSYECVGFQVLKIDDAENSGGGGNTIPIHKHTLIPGFVVDIWAGPIMNTFWGTLHCATVK